MRIPSLFSPEWIFRYLTLGMLVANLYLQNHYIGKEEYSSDKQEWTRSMTKLSDAVADLKFSLASHAEQRSILSDHENRIRLLEKVSHPKNQGQSQ